jgi:putative ABC transport system permease protein
MRSFTTNPYVLMKYDDAREAALTTPGMTNYVLIKAAGGVPASELRDAVRLALPEADVLTAEEFSQRTRTYWLFGTGVGSAFFLSALLGFIVGGAIVWQMLHALVEDQRAEFGVLKAMGAGKSVFLRIVASQALIIALVGGLGGQVLSLVLTAPIRAAGSPILLGGFFTTATAVAAVLICLGAATLPLVRVLRLEPAMVFRG